MRTFEAYARCYDLLNRDKDYAAEVRLINRWLKSAGAVGSTLLDVGCGTGNHVREFARLGWQGTGVDLSPEMIAVAQERSTGIAIDFHTGAAGAFDLGRRFAAVVSLFHVASYQPTADEFSRMLTNIRRHLAPGGIFVFDFWHGPGVLADPPAVRVRRVRDERIAVIRIAEPVHHAVECRVDVAYEVLIEDLASARVEHITELHRLRYFFLPELDAALSRAGFARELSRAGLDERELDANAWYGAIVARAI